MATALLILTYVACGFAAMAILLWLFLLLHRVVDNRRLELQDKIAAAWLEKLLVVLEGQQSVSALPHIGSKLEMEAVLNLLRDLAERFRGEYRESLAGILHHIGVEDYALKLLKSYSVGKRMRGCALLGWTTRGRHVDEALLKVLNDSNPTVRLEAAHALASRKTELLTPIVRALRNTEAIRSDRARDIIRQMAGGQGPFLAELLSEAGSSREKVLLLEGMSASGDLSQTEYIASFLKDDSALVRCAAVAALATLADPVFSDVVLPLCEDADPRVRLEVARYSSAMGQINAQDRALEKMSNDEHFEVKRAAIYGLAKLGAERWRSFRAAGHTPLNEALIHEVEHAQMGELPPQQQAISLT